MAIEDVTDVGLETHIHPFGYRRHLGDGEVLVEVMGTANVWVVL
jgi:hypothetical protein